MGLFSNKRKQAEDLVQNGQRGVGTVLQVQDTGMTINENPRVAMVFRVEPLDGSPAFDAQKTKVVSRVEIPRQGDRYPVFYDPSDPSNMWAYATIADASGRDAMRQMFGEVADSFVGMGAPVAPAAQADPLDQLERLAALHKQGALNDEEFAAQKAKLLG